MTAATGGPRVSMPGGGHLQVIGRRAEPLVVPVAVTSVGAKELPAGNEAEDAEVQGPELPLVQHSLTQPKAGSCTSAPQPRRLRRQPASRDGRSAFGLNYRGELFGAASIAGSRLHILRFPGALGRHHHRG